MKTPKLVLSVVSLVAIPPLSIMKNSANARIVLMCIYGLLMGATLLWSSTTATAADLLFKPSVRVSEEVTDNIYEQSSAKRSEYITRLLPGATFHYTSPIWTWDAAYTIEYRTYAKNSRKDENNHNAAAKGNIALVENFLFLDLSDTYKRVTLDVSRNVETESSIFLNQTDQNIASISPYLLWRLRGDNTLKTGYRFVDTRYWDSIGIDKQEHRGFADLTHDLTSRFSLSAGYAFTRLESNPSQYNKHDLYGGFKYEYADKSFIFGQLGNSWQQFDGGVDVNYLFWDAGITHDFRGTVAVLETKVSTTEDPLVVSTKETSYSAKVDTTLQRGALGANVGYSEYVNTETGIMDHTRFGITATGRYEVLQSLTATLTAIGERFGRGVVTNTLTDRPYRFTGIAGISYALKNELTVGVTYTYVNNLLDLDRTAGSYQINKAVIDLKKIF
ncbi:MAG: TIGR03016 family PEP-CTERM system-associated outer membrane protein [Desulfuromonadaceae bacterium]